MKNYLLLCLLLLSFTNDSSALTVFTEINSPDELPEELRIQSLSARDGKGLIVVAVEFAPRAPELYRGRIQAFGRLEVRLGEKVISSSGLESTRKDEVFGFKFRLARDAFENSDLTLSTQLYEKDGHPTLGGGQIFKVHLKGFCPQD